MAAGASETISLTPSDDAFSLWLGDPDMGDQTGMTIALDHGPRTQSLEVGGAGSLPLHQALDGDGRVWVTMEGSDELVRLDPDRRGDQRRRARALPAARRPQGPGQPAARQPDRRAARPGRRRHRRPRHGLDDAGGRQRDRAPGPEQGAARLHGGHRGLQARAVQQPVPQAAAADRPRPAVARAAAARGVRGRWRQHRGLVHRDGRRPHRRDPRDPGGPQAQRDALRLRQGLPDAPGHRARRRRPRLLQRGHQQPDRPADPRHRAPVHRVGDRRHRPLRDPLERRGVHPRRRPVRGAAGLPAAQPGDDLAASQRADRPARPRVVHRGGDREGRLPRPGQGRAATRRRGWSRPTGRSTTSSARSPRPTSPSTVRARRSSPTSTATRSPPPPSVPTGRSRCGPPSARPRATASPTRRCSTTRATCGSSRAAPRSVTRVSSVSAGAPRPARSPLLVADTSTGTLSAEGLREMDAVDLVVLRDGSRGRPRRRHPAVGRRLRDGAGHARRRPRAGHPQGPARAAVVRLPRRRPARDGRRRRRRVGPGPPRRRGAGRRRDDHRRREDGDGADRLRGRRVLVGRRAGSGHGRRHALVDGGHGDRALPHDRALRAERRRLRAAGGDAVGRGSGSGPAGHARHRPSRPRAPRPRARRPRSARPRAG